MQFQNIVCLLNILSPWRAKADGFFDFIREPIRQACGINISYAPGKLPSNMVAGFDLEHFSKIAITNKISPLKDLWLATYHDMPEAALDYLFAHLPQQPLILSSEMPPWLRKACEQRKQVFIDIRQSPLGFGRDSYIAIDTNSALLRNRLAQWAISQEELRLEASILSANMRIHRRQLEESMHHTFNLDNTIIYLWQPSWDISLLQPDGHTLHISEFSSQLKDLAQGRKLLFMRDFSDPHGYHVNDLLEKERSTLSTIVGYSVRFCPQNIYQILTSVDDCELISINTGYHQESFYFDKNSHSLSNPVTPLAASTDSPGYLQFNFQDIISPTFWHQTLTPCGKPPRLLRLPHLDRQYARESMNDWGEYEKVLTWERSLPWHAFRRLGGIVQGRRIAALEEKFLNFTKLNNDVNNTSEIDSERIKALKNSKKGKTAYILGNGPSINELDINRLLQLDSFWCNNAFKLQDKGYKFTPKYFFYHDAFGIQKNSESIAKFDAEIKFFSQESGKIFKILQPEASKDIIILNVTDAVNKINDIDNLYIDPSIYIYSGASSIILMMQFAFYMGYSKILLGGVDLDYSKPYFYNEFNPLKDSLNPISENTKRDILLLKSYFEKRNVFLGKITTSPKLPLEYINIDGNTDNPLINHCTEK